MDPLSDKRRKYLSVGEVAEYFGLSRSKVYQMVDRKELGALKLGNAIRVPREEIERLERDSALRLRQNPTTPCLPALSLYRSSRWAPDRRIRLTYAAGYVPRRGGRRNTHGTLSEHQAEHQAEPRRNPAGVAPPTRGAPRTRSRRRTDGVRTVCG